MKTKIFCVNGMYLVRTGKVFAYVINVDPDSEAYMFADEVIDICTGNTLAYNELLCFVDENPSDSYIEEKPKKRGRKSMSHNKRNARFNKLQHSFDDLPF